MMFFVEILIHIRLNHFNCHSKKNELEGLDTRNIELARSFYSFDLFVSLWPPFVPSNI